MLEHPRDKSLDTNMRTQWTPLPASKNVCQHSPRRPSSLSLLRPLDASSRTCTMLDSPIKPCTASKELTEIPPKKNCTLNSKTLNPQKLFHHQLDSPSTRDPPCRTPISSYPAAGTTRCPPQKSKQSVVSVAVSFWLRRLGVQGLGQLREVQELNYQASVTGYEYVLDLVVLLQDPYSNPFWGKPVSEPSLGF